MSNCTPNILITRPVIKAVIVPRPVYKIVTNHGSKGYQWAKITIPELTTLIEHELFKKDLGPLMLYKGSPMDWEELNIEQNKVAGTLDTFAYGEMKGVLKFQYK